MTDLGLLRQRATELGVEIGYRDVDGYHHDTPEATLRHVVDVLEHDVERTRPPVPPVVVVGGPAATGHDLDVGSAAFADLTLTDGTTLRLPAHDGRVDLPPDVPFGCHDVRIDDDHATTLVVAPPAMPRAADLEGRAGLFVPVYALWTDTDPLPSFGHLADLAARLPDLGLDVLSTLPLYAAFLDAPFDPSPYSPMSRLHWNEVYLDDASLPGAPRPPMGELVDWPTLARRRRRQLLAAAAELDEATEAALAAHVTTHPDVVDYARFRAARPDTVDAAHRTELVQRSHL
ncbi:MAG: 4-alpha-glucanotransferase, partial [Ilumatobacteraceae bacterium]